MDNRELSQEFRALVEFAKGSKVPAGFAYMDVNGVPDPSKPLELWINCRMTHIFALADMLGVQGTREYMDHGVAALSNYFRDPVYGGWFSSIEAAPAPDGTGIPVDDGKAAYQQAFVVLAASSGVAAGSEAAAPLLDQALAEQEQHWLEPETSRVRESWNRDFTESEEYRGINANMHTVEALLAAADVLGNNELLERATNVLRFVYDRASERSWRIPEHYSATWDVLADYNVDEPAHPFRPFGVTPGHGLEWARLMLHARGTRKLKNLPVGDWMLEGAENLIASAVADGWNADGAPGFVYTTDFDGVPVTHERMHWVLCEAIGAGVVLSAVLREEGRSGDAEAMEAHVSQWWDYATTYVREAPGRWIHELDRENRPSYVTWPGKPDVYHAGQMTLLPMLPVSPTFAAAIRDGLGGLVSE